MYLDPNVLLILVVVLVWVLPPIFGSYVIWSFGKMTRTVMVPHPDPSCDICHGDGHFLHHGHCVLPCWRGCAEPKPQTVMHWRMRFFIRRVAKRMGMDDANTDKFARDFEDLVNSHLGPPIPCFVKTESGWEYRTDGKKVTT